MSVDGLGSRVVRTDRGLTWLKINRPRGQHAVASVVGQTGVAERCYSTNKRIHAVWGWLTTPKSLAMVSQAKRPMNKTLRVRNEQRVDVEQHRTEL